MSFSPIVIGASTFVETNRGRYVVDVVDYNDPTNEIKLRPGTLRNDGNISAGVTRSYQIDVGTGDDMVRETAVVTCNIIVPPSGAFTKEVLSAMVGSISTFLTADNLNDLLAGKY